MDFLFSVVEDDEEVAPVVRQILGEEESPVSLVLSSLLDLRSRLVKAYKWRQG